MLVGLQLHGVLNRLGTVPAGKLVGYAVAVSAAAILVRLVSVLHDALPDPVARSVSLAAALALPLTTDAGGPFPSRDLIIFLTYAVIFATLVIQGLSLPWLIRVLHITRGGDEENEEIRARLVASKAALAELDELEREEWTRDDTIERLRTAYQYRKRRFAAQAGAIEDDGYEDRSLAYQQIVQLVLAAQREALVRMRNSGEISNETMNHVIRDLDLEESRLEI